MGACVIDSFPRGRAAGRECRDASRARTIGCPHLGGARHPSPNDWERGRERVGRARERCAVAVGIGPLRDDREGLGVTGGSNRVVDDVLTGTDEHGVLLRSRSPTGSRPLSS
jgi:hypothetical protein